MPIKDTAALFKHGQQNVGTEMVRIIEVNFTFLKYLLLRTPGANDPVPNTNMIWIGGPGVTPNDGMPIAPGETLKLPLENGKRLYAVSTAADQKLAWIGM
jgi:hypothetical protein